MSELAHASPISYRLAQQARHQTCCGTIDDGPPRRGDWHAFLPSHILRCEVIVVDAQVTRDGTADAIASWHSDMNLGRVHIRQLPESQCRLVGQDTLDAMVPASRPEGSLEFLSGGYGRELR